ncbi:MAG: hypothetical protein SVT52_03195, partial [Planctomycetota bacterium]|nr:hypothetical protein [Planctomycetota bacterium]
MSLFATLFLVLVSTAGYALAQKPAVLVTGQVGVGIRFLIDPELEKKLTQDGYRVGSLSLADLTAERLKQFNTVILVQETAEGALGDRKDQAGLVDRGNKLLLEHVKAGGGLLLFYDEMHYTEQWDFVLNKLLADLDAEVGREKVVEKDASRVHVFPLLAPRGFYQAFSTECIEPHAVTEQVKTLWWPMFTGTIKRLGEPWKVIITGSETAETAKTYRTKPLLLVVRTYGKGRVALFMGHSSFYVNNGYHLAYEIGWCLEKGDGYRLFTNLFNWLGEPSQKSGVCGGYKPGSLPPLPKAGGVELKPYHDLDDAPAFAGVFGVYSNHSGGLYTVKQWADKARSLGLKFLAFTDRIESRHVWEQLKADCLAASDEDFVAIPGVEFVAGEKVWVYDRKEFLREKTSVGFAVNIDKWPPSHGLHSGNYLFIDTLLTTGEQNMGIYVLAQPKLNGMRPENLGGFNAFEVASFRGMNSFTGAADWFRAIQANAGFSAAPIVSHRLWRPDELEQVAAEGFKLHLFAKDVPSLRKHIATDIVPSYVSNGPVIERFWVEDFISDPWERYFLWNVGDVARIHLKVRSSKDLKQVRLYSGLRVIREFFPAGGQLDETIEFPMTQDGPFYVEAEDRSGRIALSYAIPTRNLNYWNHVGSDRMNDYHNPILPDEDGEIVYQGRRLGYGGLVTLAYGWGEYCRFYHPVPGWRFHPQGYETGQINAGVANVRTYPVVQAHNTNEQAEPRARRSMP